MSYFIRFRVLDYKYMLIASKKISLYCLLIFINENYSYLSLFLFFLQNAREYLDFQKEFSDL
jgi:hypothetical protein